VESSMHMLTWSNNVALGNRALFGFISGSNNTALGANAIFRNYINITNNASVDQLSAQRLKITPALGGSVSAGDIVFMFFSASTIPGSYSNALYKVINPSTLEILPEFNATFSSTWTATANLIAKLPWSPASNRTVIGANAWDTFAGGDNTILIGANTDALDDTTPNQLNIGNWIYGSGGQIWIWVQNPLVPLQVWSTTTPSSMMVQDILGYSSSSAHTFAGGSSYTDGGAISVYGSSAWTYPGAVLLRYWTWITGFILNNLGNIGIGTSTPWAKLEVAGQVKITGGTPWVGKVLVSDAAGLASWMTPSSGRQVCPGSGTNNTCYGTWALWVNTTGQNNTANWYYALGSNTTGQNNTANWYYALGNSTAWDENIANWSYALFANITWSYNIANWYYALNSNTTWVGNIWNWAQSLTSNTTWVRNIANWTLSLASNTTWNYNIANWYRSLYSNSTWNYNIANWYDSLFSMISGDDNISIGKNTWNNLINWSNNIFIWSNAQPTGSTVSNQLNIGNWIYGNNGNIGIGTSTPTEKLHVNWNILASSYLYTSDKRLKNNIQTFSGADLILSKLRGVSFDWKDSGRSDIGFIAQEVESVLPDLVHTDSAGMKSVEYANIVPVLVEGYKYQKERADNLEKRLQDLEKRMDTLEWSNR
jgi:trimeric autotransporter adhesin